jgi:putative membrane protein
VIRFLIRTAITALGVLLVAYLGLIRVEGFNGSEITQHAYIVAFIFALVLGIVNAIIRPVVQILALPISILTLGLFAILVNLGMFYLAAYFVREVTLSSDWLITGLAAIIISVISGIAGSVTKRTV